MVKALDKRDIIVYNIIMGKGKGGCDSRQVLNIGAGEVNSSPEFKDVLVNSDTLKTKRADDKLKIILSENSIKTYGSKTQALVARAVAPNFRKIKKSHREALTGKEVYTQEVNRRPVLPYYVQKQLCIIAQDENESPRERALAKQAMIWHNQKYVIQQAYSDYWKGRGVDPEELTQEGTQGLIRAIEKYDPESGNTFLTYGKRQIFKFMQRYTENISANVYGSRIPTDRYNEIHVTVKSAYSILNEILERSPTANEIHQAILDNPEVKKKLSLKRVEEALGILNNKPVSMQSSIGDSEEDMEFGNTLSSKQAGPAQEAHNNELKNQIETAFNNLDKEKQNIVGPYLGLGGYAQNPSLNDIARELEMKPSQVTRIYNQAREEMIKSFNEKGHTKESMLSNS